MALLVRAGIRRWFAFFSCIALATRYRWCAHENLWRSLREWRSPRGEGGSETGALRPEKILDRRADEIDLRGGVVRTDGEAEDFVGEPFGERKIAALPAGGAVGV